MNPDDITQRGDVLPVITNPLTVAEIIALRDGEAEVSRSARLSSGDFRRGDCIRAFDDDNIRKPIWLTVEELGEQGDVGNIAYSKRIRADSYIDGQIRLVDSDDMRAKYGRGDLCLMTNEMVTGKRASLLRFTRGNRGELYELLENIMVDTRDMTMHAAELQAITDIESSFETASVNFFTSDDFDALFQTLLQMNALFRTALHTDAADSDTQNIILTSIHTPEALRKLAVYFTEINTIVVQDVRTRMGEIVTDQGERAAYPVVEGLNFMTEARAMRRMDRMQNTVTALFVLMQIYADERM